MKFRSRVLHRLLSPWIFLPLVLAAITGMAYRGGKTFGNLDKESADFLMKIHSGEWMGTAGSVLYTALLGSALLFLLASGLKMILGPASGQKRRRIHRALGMILLLPLAITAVTGMLYKPAELLGFPEETTDVLMMLHEGAWLGKPAKAYYVLAVGCGLLALGLAGLSILFRKKRPA